MTSVDVESFEGTAPAKPAPVKPPARTPAPARSAAAKPASAAKSASAKPAAAKQAAGKEVALRPAPARPVAPKVTLPVPAATPPAQARTVPASATPAVAPAAPAAPPAAVRPRPVPATPRPTPSAPPPVARPAAAAAPVIPSAAMALRAFSAKPVPPPEIDADVGHMLALWRGMGGAALETLTPEQARRMPQLAAVQHRYVRAGDDFGVESGNVQVPGAAGRLEARLYRRRQGRPGMAGALIVFFPCGAFVAGSLDGADLVARTLAQRTGAQVLSVMTRRAPEHRFPAAHDDAMAVWRWIAAEAGAIGVDAGRMAVAGEGTGASLALGVALGARLEKITRPVHAALVTPLAGMTFDTQSHRVNAMGLPLGTAGVKWIGQHLFSESKQAYDRRIALTVRPDLGAAPPTTLILAGADPLRSDGEALGAALARARVPVAMHLYEGMPHGFFGLFLVVNKAMFAMAEVSFNLAEALGNGPGP